MLSLICLDAVYMLARSISPIFFIIIYLFLGGRATMGEKYEEQAHASISCKCPTDHYPVLVCLTYM